MCLNKYYLNIDKDNDLEFYRAVYTELRETWTTETEITDVLKIMDSNQKKTYKEIVWQTLSKREKSKHTETINPLIKKELADLFSLDSSYTVELLIALRIYLGI